MNVLISLQLFLPNSKVNIALWRAVIDHKGFDIVEFRAIA